MARLETVDTFKKSGWSLTVLREGDDLKTFTEDMMEQLRAGAETRMVRALDHIVGAIKRTLSRQYPIATLKGSTFTSASGTLRRRKRTRHQPSAPGAPPGKITGALAASWKRRKPTWKKDRTILEGRYYSRHPAAGRLEFGDAGKLTKRFREGKRKSGIGIPSRPYQRPTLAREGDRLTAILEGTE